MPNNIALITKYSTSAWDKVYKQESRSALLDGKEGVNVQWTGTKTVKIAKFNAGGLKNYYRNSNSVSGTGVPTTARTGNEPFMGNLGYGYQASNVGLTWEEFTISMDRAAAYPIEYFDNEETDGLVLGAATTEISRTVMIPEVDAYCFSKLVDYCSAASETITLADGTTRGGLDNYVVYGGNGNPAAITNLNALAAINAAFLYMDEHEIPAEDQILFVSPKYFNYLRNDTSELARYLMQSDYNKDVKFTLTEYEGRQIVVVPPQRFRTKFTTVTQSGAGYGFGWWDAAANNGEGALVESQEIHFILCAKSAVMHVVKYNKVKILSGDVALAATCQDGYALYARVYHDVFVMDNKRFAIYAAINGGSDKTTVTAATSSTPAKEVPTSTSAELE